MIDASPDVLQAVLWFAFALGLPFWLLWGMVKDAEARRETLAELTTNPLPLLFGVFALACWIAWPIAIAVEWRYWWIPLTGFLSCGALAFMSPLPK